MLTVLMQAGYHGIPIVGIPVFGDQPDNVMKAVFRGFGLMISPGTITEATLVAAVGRVTTEPRFREAARKVSVRMRAHRVSPAEKAAGGWCSSSSGLSTLQGEVAGFYSPTLRKSGASRLCCT
jgi:UDP:flavonoid glycosyltransferase YjiC (YdhE family)